MLSDPMAHLSLYRKYRPQTFADVVGQQHVTRTLQTALKQDRLAHALLFSGPRGTGKTSTARILARALNCHRPGQEPCGECSSCKQIASGVSLDVVEIDAASHGSVDDARELREKVAYSSVEGRWKVYIIDECHMLSPAANNALLKVLEEPPGHVVFVFATTEPNKVLQTVLDRCQRYEFRSIGTAGISGRLALICESEGISADEQTLSLIARRAGGSVRDALSLLDQLRSYAGDRIEVGDLAQLLGKLPDDVLFEAIDLIAERDIGAVFMFCERLIRSGVDMREFARGLTDHLRSLFLVLHAPAAQEILEVSDDQLTRLQEQANRFESAEVLRLIDLTNETQLQLRQAVNGRLALEVGLVRMTRPDLHATPASLLARIDRLERGRPLEGAGAQRLEAGGSETLPGRPDATAQVPPAARGVPKLSIPPGAQVPVRQDGPPDAPVRQPMTPETPGTEPQIPAAFQLPAVASSPNALAPSAEPGPPADPASIDIARIERAWPQVLERVKRRKISLHAMLNPAKPAAWSHGELVLEFERRSKFHRDKVADVAQHGPLIEAFNDILGVRPQLSCVLAAESTAPGRAADGPVETDDPTDETDGGDGQPVPDAIEMIRRAFDANVVGDDSKKER
ncbi:MAG: DNA polymerase III subunit gamma/tau [Actinomycetota bacterium]